MPTRNQHKRVGTSRGAGPEKSHSVDNKQKYTVVNSITPVEFFVTWYPGTPVS